MTSANVTVNADSLFENSDSCVNSNRGKYTKGEKDEHNTLTHIERKTCLIMHRSNQVFHFQYKAVRQPFCFTNQT